MMDLKRKRMGSVLLAALLSVSAASGVSVVSVFAGEDTAGTAAEAETDMETENPEPETEAPEIELLWGSESLTVTDKTGLAIESLAYEPVSTETSGDAEEESEASTEEAEAFILLAVEADGTIHTFEDVDLAGLSGLTLIEKIGFVFLTGTDEAGDEKYFYETADAVELESPVTMYTVGMVNIREEADGNSTLLGTAERGSEVEVFGGTSAWFLVTQGELTGYVAARYLTEDAGEAEAAVEAEASARAAIEAAAQAAAVAAAGSGSSGSSSSSSGAKTEVSREAVYDCDGSNSGYYIITYSDGTVEYVDF